jgi:hypothetical protein
MAAILILRVFISPSLSFAVVLVVVLMVVLSNLIHIVPALSFEVLLNNLANRSMVLSIA